MKHYKHFLIAFFAVAVLGTPWIISVYPNSTKIVDNIFSYIGNNYSAVFFREGITVAQLQDKFDKADRARNQKVRIMIVPGHEPGYGGAEFGSVKERDLAVELANELKFFLQNNPHYEVFVSRDKDKWNADIEKYFTDNRNEIIEFVSESKNEMIRLINDGTVRKIVNGVIHNSAPQNVAVRLHGINRWNEENNVDIAIHVHFNDYPRSNSSSQGKYTGFAIYVPERQFSNSTTTNAIAQTVYERLSKYNAVSNMPKEESGVVEAQELIAIGSYNTLDVPSMLIEYGYIYEPQFTNPDVRQSTLKDLAFQTYLGIQDFFGSGNDVSLAYDTLVLPYLWKQEITKGEENREEVLALQTALIIEGVYPPESKTKNECPRTGKFGPCTANALTVFQNKHGIKGESNKVGEQTKKVLNDLYSVSIK
jgi:N-acetylmuramoyl-L-alanine amidase